MEDDRAAARDRIAAQKSGSNAALRRRSRAHGPRPPPPNAAPFAAGSGELDVTSVAYEDFEGAGFVASTEASRRRWVAIRGARASRIRTTFDQVDALGHVRQQTAHGQVGHDSDAPAIDPTIVGHTVPVLVSGPPAGSGAPRGRA